jgi:(E)-4-hydroxy-3-methylbut-2-enyl-diphosphate synthase
MLAKKVKYPLHLGVTEAGTAFMGSIKSAIGIGILLEQGIGATMRVSLTADPVEEIATCWGILRALDLRRRGPEMISCPTCGRTQIDLIPLAEKVEAMLKKIDKPIKVAVMGCVVNGPGEAREADFGIAGGRGEGLLFRHGEIVRKVPEAQLADALVEEVLKAVNGERGPGIS